MCALTACVLLATPRESNAVTVSDANGVVLGEFVSTDGGKLAFMTSKGFLGYVNPGRKKMVNPPYTFGPIYLSEGCIGQPYAIDGSIRPVVFSSDEDVLTEPYSSVFYIRADAETITLKPGQHYYFWARNFGGATPVDSCTEWNVHPDSPVQVVPAAPNDPAVTGISNGTFVPPFKLSMRRVFEDGFDGV